MNTKKNIAIGLVLGAVVVSLGFLIGVSKSTIVQKITETTQEPSVKGLAGPDIQYPYIAVGGLATYSTRVQMGSASTTLCSMQSPSSTSTLRVARAIFNFATSTAAYTEISNATTAFASTTVISRLTLAAAAQGSLVATTSATALTDGLVAPNTYINVKMTSASPAGANTRPDGYCTAEFTVL